MLKTRFINLRRRCASDGDFRLFLRKGIYPYEYMDSFDRFEEVELPPIESFIASSHSVMYQRMTILTHRRFMKPWSVEI